MSYTKTEKTKQPTEGTEYHLVAYVKDTNQENGPGHVSVSAMKRTREQSTVHHTSFFPGFFGSFINGISLGSVPVKGQLAPTHQQDLNEAEHVLIKPIDKEQYRKAKKAHQEFSQEVDKGERYYSVFGSLNPLSMLFTTAFTAHRGAQLTAEWHKEMHGQLPPEDHCGIHIYDNDSHREVNLKTDNCASAVTHVLHKAGIPLENPLVPSLFPPSLEEHGFKPVEKEQFLKKTFSP